MLSLRLAHFVMSLTLPIGLCSMDPDCGRQPYLVGDKRPFSATEYAPDQSEQESAMILERPIGFFELWVQAAQNNTSLPQLPQELWCNIFEHAFNGTTPQSHCGTKKSVCEALGHGGLLLLQDEDFNKDLATELMTRYKDYCTVTEQNTDSHEMEDFSEPFIQSIINTTQSRKRLLANFKDNVPRTQFLFKIIMRQFEDFAHLPEKRDQQVALEKLAAWLPALGVLLRSNMVTAFLMQNQKSLLAQKLYLALGFSFFDAPISTINTLGEPYTKREQSFVGRRVKRSGLDAGFQLYLANGGSINERNSRGNTLLHLFVWHRAPCDFDDLAALIAHGADARIKNDSRRTPHAFAWHLFHECTKKIDAIEKQNEKLLMRKNMLEAAVADDQARGDPTKKKKKYEIRKIKSEMRQLHKQIIHNDLTVISLGQKRDELHILIPALKIAQFFPDLVQAAKEGVAQRSLASIHVISAAYTAMRK